MTDHMMSQSKDPFWKKWIDQCSLESYTFKGADGNDLPIHVIKSLANKDAKDLVPVVDFHGGGAWCGTPL